MGLPTKLKRQKNMKMNVAGSGRSIMSTPFYVGVTQEKWDGIFGWKCQKCRTSSKGDKYRIIEEREGMMPKEYTVCKKCYEEWKNANKKKSN
jgi:hypothetical protein